MLRYSYRFLTYFYLSGGEKEKEGIEHFWKFTKTRKISIRYRFWVWPLAYRFPLRWTRAPRSRSFCSGSNHHCTTTACLSRPLCSVSGLYCNDRACRVRYASRNLGRTVRSTARHRTNPITCDARFFSRKVFAHLRRIISSKKTSQRAKSDEMFAFPSYPRVFDGCLGWILGWDHSHRTFFTVL